VNAAAQDASVAAQDANATDAADGSVENAAANALESGLDATADQASGDAVAPPAIAVIPPS
jgi:hypothetical protein